jgi:hypothetical protein
VAFVRWRGNSAELLTTVYDQGRSRQLHLATLGGAYTVAPEIRDGVTTRFPEIRVNWDAVEQALIEGPPHERAQTTAGMPNERLEWLELERRLRYWAAMAEPLRPDQARSLRSAAAVLAEWRWGKPAFPIAQPLPGWDAELAGPPAGGTSAAPRPLGPGRDT